MGLHIHRAGGVCMGRKGASTMAHLGLVMTVTVTRSSPQHAYIFTHVRMALHFPSRALFHQIPPGAQLSEACPLYLLNTYIITRRYLLLPFRSVGRDEIDTTDGPISPPIHGNTLSSQHTRLLFVLALSAQM
jgi:hypothetical protein